MADSEKDLSRFWADSMWEHRLMRRFTLATGPLLGQSAAFVSPFPEIYTFETSVHRDPDTKFRSADAPFLIVSLGSPFLLGNFDFFWLSRSPRSQFPQLVSDASKVMVRITRIT
jgi:hypothetical protein